MSDQYGPDISEDSSKNRRGRPRLMDADIEKAYRSLWGTTLSLRTIQNRRYGTRAMMILTPDDADEATKARFAWVFDPDADVVKHSILEELGRTPDPEALRVVAEHICDNRLRTREAVTLIRRIRLGESPADVQRLADAILAVINADVARHPTANRLYVTMALMDVLDTVQLAEEST